MFSKKNQKADIIEKDRLTQVRKELERLIVDSKMKTI